MPRARDGDVGEPALLALVMGGDLRLEVLHRVEQFLAVGGAAPGELRQLGGVAAQLVGKNAEAQPALRAVARARGQFAVDAARHGDVVPLKPFRAVDGEHLHGAGLGVFRARRQVVAPLGLAQPGEEAAEGRVVGKTEVAVEGVEEGSARGVPEHAVRVCGDLDIELQLVLDRDDEVGQRERAAPAQGGEHAARLA